MKPYKIAFIGNREVSNCEVILKTLVAFLEEWVYSDIDTYPIYYCGGYGQFSQIASEAIDILRKRYPEFDTEKLFVTPYIAPSYQPTLQAIKEFYDDVIYPPLEAVPPRFAISRRNQWMIDECDVLIAYMQNPCGNTRKCVDYAVRRQTPVLFVGAGRVDCEENSIFAGKSEIGRKTRKKFFKISKKT